MSSNPAGVRVFRSRSYKAWILCLLKIPKVTLDTRSGCGGSRFAWARILHSSVSKALLQGLDILSFTDSKGNVRHPFGLRWRQVWARILLVFECFEGAPTRLGYCVF